MIQTNELRRGNLVNHAARKDQKGNVFAGLIGPFRVDEIREKSLSVTHLPDGLPFGMSYKDAEGIPLTPELLEALGFKKSINAFRFKKDRIFIYEPGRPEHLHALGMMGVGIIRPGLKYLHELQNLYFALTGAELEIKLIV